MLNRLIGGVVKRELTLALRQKAEVLQPLIFIIMVVTLFPLGVSPSPELLTRIGPGVIWIAAILSILLSLERIFRDDFNDGSLEQLMLSDLPVAAVAVAKVFCHWLISIGPLLFLLPLLSLLLNLSASTTYVLAATLVLGTPVLSFLGAISVALTVGLRKSGLLLPLLLIPVFIPLLIFATSAIDSARSQLPYAPQLAIIGAMFLFTSAFAPSAIAYALKVSQH
jgi:heme exporter protein B